MKIVSRRIRNRLSYLLPITSIFIALSNIYGKDSLANYSHIPISKKSIKKEITTISPVLHNDSHYAIKQNVEPVFGDDNSEYNTAQNTLPIADQLYARALELYYAGEYAEAIPLANQAFVIYNQILGSDHPDTLNSRTTIAALNATLGRYDEAEVLYIGILDAYERLGLRDLSVGAALSNLASLYISQRRYDDAEPLSQRALDIAEQQLGANDPDLVLALNNLAVVYRWQRRYDDAEPLYQRALAIAEQRLGLNHPTTASILENLAVLYHSTGDYSRAEEIYKRTLRIAEQQLGSDHPDVIQSLENIASLYYEQEQFQEALNYLERALDVEGSVLNNNLSGGSDIDQASYIYSLSGTTNFAINMHLDNLLSDVRAAQLTFDAILNRKGRALDFGTDMRTEFLNNPRALGLFEDLITTNEQLSALTYSPPNDQTELWDLQLRSRLLERELNKFDLDFSEFFSDYSTETIQAALPPNTALIEFVRYWPLDLTAPEGEEYNEAHYAAYVVQPDGRIHGMNLGSAEVVEAAIESLSENLADSNTPPFQVKESARALDMLVMAPIREVLGSTSTIFLAPDGALNLIPFEALVDESNNYLVENYQFRYLTSGRDLTRRHTTPSSKNRSVLIGDPTYATTGTSVAETRALDFENRIFPILPGTQVEVELISSMLENAEVYTGTEATESIVKDLNSPRILHIATHGFFELDSRESYNPFYNPLVQSGLVLAGAAERSRGRTGQDGLVSALEVTNLNLRGTQLAVLSACETGLGTLVVSGEGVFGLRRALTVAGAQSQVISLWKVDDMATQELMVNYYSRLLSGTSRDAALRETQLGFLNSEKYSHPYYWAAFIGSGNWRPLDE